MPAPDGETPKIPTPSEYMRSARPELFSDSVLVDVTLLERSQLEYHLETLTNRKEEFVFEDFCKRLSEREICPNLKPQTGPVGGGDSKTDSSTYPVAPVLIERCYWGSPNPPTDESWAFAFSAKKDWRPKVKSDILKIAELENGFTTVYFITNQFVKDKTRAELEAELTEKHGFDVHIFDRQWILDVVFSHKCELLAIESLGIRVAAQQSPHHGPNDTARRDELDDLLNKLRTPLDYFANDYSIAAAYLRAAELARGLEKPRHEVSGLYQQARRVSRQCGYLPQLVCCAYEHAWTENWWYDDVSTAIEVYEEMESHLPHLEDASDIEMFANLQSLMWTAVFRGEHNHDALKLRDREDSLREKLQKLSQEQLRPNDALYAETMLAFLEFAPWNRDRVDEETLQRLADCFQRSRGLTTYPLKRFTDTVIGTSAFLEKLPGYDALFDTIREVLVARDGEIANARLLVQRGEQLQQAGRPKDAIRMLSDARIMAAKEETLEVSVQAACLAAICYTSEGLVWAARMEALVAAQLSCKPVNGKFQSAWYASRATRLLAWIDLSCGRLSSFLRWMGIATNCLNQLVEDGFDIDQFRNSYQTIEDALCSRLMLVDEAMNRRLEPLADALHYFGFPMARFVILYNAGRADEITEEFTTAFEEDEEWMRGFFAKWKQGLGTTVAGVFAGQNAETPMYLTTKRMGVQYVVECDPDFGTVAFAENLLGVLESLLAVAECEDLAFITDTVHIKIRLSDDGTNPPEPKTVVGDEAESLLLAWNTGVADWMAYADRQEFCRYLMKICLAILLHATGDSVGDLRDELEVWLNDGVLNRALSTSPSVLAIAELIGKDSYNLDECVATAAQ